jgi:hypothetical protein
MPSPADVAGFHERGYLVTPPLFPVSTLDAVQREIERIWREEQDKARADPRRLAFARARPELPRLHLRSPVLSAFCRSRALAAIAVAIAGSNVDLFYNQAYAKAPGADPRTAVPWHQDAFYAETDRLTYNCWIAVTRATLDSGTLRFAPRPATPALLHHEWDESLQFYRCDVDERLATPVVLERGQAFVYATGVPHASGVNASGGVRIAYSVGFAVAGVRLRANGEAFGDRVAVVRAGRPVADWMAEHARGDSAAREVAEGVLRDIAQRLPDGDGEALVRDRFSRCVALLDAGLADRWDDEVGQLLALVEPDVEVLGDLKRARARVDQLLQEYERVRGRDPVAARHLLERVLELDADNAFAKGQLQERDEPGE